MFAPSVRRALIIALAATIPVVGVTTFGVSRALASGSVVFNETFTNNSVPDSHWVIGGSSFVPCLTASGNSTVAPIKSCAGTTDTAGNGALRLTSAGTGQSGYIFYNQALPATAGLDISFDSYQYDGTGADGIAFFLTDGQFDLTAPGTQGGYLGYAGGNHGIGNGNGVAHGLFGVGLDAYGNFSNFENSPANGGGNCSDSYTPAFHPNWVVLRGPGDADKVNYCHLAGVAAPSSLTVDAATDRTDGGANDVVRHVHIVVDPSSNVTPMVTVSVAGVQVLQTAEPAMSSTVKFGWTSSTGGSTDIHELQNVDISTINALAPSLSVTNSVNNAGTFLSGGGAAGDATYTITNSGAANFETHPFTVTVPVPAGLGETSVTAVDPNMSCAASTTTLLSCTYTPTGYGFAPGQSVSVDLNFSPLATYSHKDLVLTASVTSPDGGSPTVNQTLQVNPVTVPAAVTTNANTAATVLQAANGSAPFTWTVGPGTGNPALVSTATVDALGNLTVTPVTGASGTTTIPLHVTDGSGATSATVNVPVTVVPTVSPVSGSGTGPAPVLVNIPAPVGTGPFTYGFVTTPNAATQGSVAFVSGSPEQVKFTPVSGFSGAVPTFTYRVTDAASVPSASATIDITVNKPSAPTVSPLTGTIDAGTSFTQSVPPPAGASPFSYAITTAPPAGTETISNTGSVDFTPPATSSGVYSSAYQAQDQYGQASSNGLIQVTVRPVVAAFSGTTSGTTPLIVNAPTPLGTGPFTWSGTTPQTNGTLAMDSSTGQVTFTANVGYTGSFTFPYTVADASSTSSTSKLVTITVNAPAAPVAVADSFTLNADTTLNGQLPAPSSGTGPFTYAVVAPPSTGTLTVSGSGAVTFTPAAGTSGVVTFTYKVTDAYGTASTPATVTLNVLPVAPNLSGTTNAGQPVSVTATPIDGTGPFTYNLTQPNPAQGSATVNQATGVITFTPAAGYSGNAPFTYTVTGAGPTTSAPASVAIAVRPTVADVSATTTVNNPVTVTPPTPVGSGPFTWAIATAPSSGTVTINPNTGAMTYTPANNASGVATYTYIATDSQGVASLPATATIHVVPNGAPVSTTVPAGSGPVTMTLPTRGTGPFTCTLVTSSVPPASQGTVTINPSTCTATFTPAPGFAGTASFQYIVTDAAGIISAPSTASVTVVASIAIPPAPDTGVRAIPLVVRGAALALLGLLLLLAGAHSGRRRRIIISATTAAELRSGPLRRI